MSACIVISSPTDSRLLEVIEEGFTRNGESSYYFNKINGKIPYDGVFPKDILVNIKRKLDQISAQSWGDIRSITATAISNYLLEHDFGTSDFFEDYIARNPEVLTISEYVNRELVPRLNSIGSEQINEVSVKEVVSGNKVGEQEKDPTLLVNGLSSIFDNSSDLNLFVTRNKNALIRELFIGTYGVIAGDIDLSFELQEHQQRLINELIYAAEDITSDKGIIDEFKTIDVYDAENMNLVAFNKLIKFYDTYFQSNMSENKGKFYSSDSFERDLFFNYLMLKNFDSFIKNYLNDLIKIQPGYENSFSSTLNGEPKYSSNIQVNPRQNWNDNKIESIADHTSKAVQLFLQTINVAEDVPLNPTNFSRAIAWIRDTFTKDFAQVRNNPQKLQQLYKKVYNNVTRTNKVDNSIKDAIVAIYNAVFDDSPESESLYNLFKDKKNIKYNLYDMLLNQISKTSPLKYLQTVYDVEEGMYVTKELSSDAVNEKKTLFEKSIMINFKKLDLDALSNKYNIKFDLNNLNAIYKVDIRLGQFTLSAIYDDNSIKYIVTTPESSTELQPVDIVRIIFGNSKGRKLISDIFGKTFDSTYWDILTQQNTINVVGVLDLAINSLIGAKLFNDNFKNIEDLRANEDFIKSTIKSKFAYNFKGSPDYKWFNSSIGTLRPGGLSRGYQGLLAIARTNAAITGDNSKSQVKDINNNSLPKFGLTSAMNDDIFVLQRLDSRIIDTISKDPRVGNIFYGTKILGDSFADLEVVSSDGKSKSVSDLTAGELGMHRFLNGYLRGNNRTAYIQPTTYADKSRIWVKKINMLARLTFQAEDLAEFNNRTLSDMSSTELSDLWRKSMNLAYKAYSENITEDYRKLFTIAKYNDYSDELSAEFSNITFDEGLEIFNAFKFSKFDLHNVLTRAQALGVNLRIGPELHYQPKYAKDKATGQKYLKAGNTTFRFFREMYSNPELFNKKNTIEKGLFAYTLFAEGVKFEVTNGNGVIDKSLLGLRNKYPNWYDKDTDEIISYKVYDSNGKEIENPDMSIDNVYDADNFRIELHPELDRYYSLDNLISDNYNAILFGFSYAHKGQKNKEFNSKAISWVDIMGYKEEESARTVAEYKRGVIGGATIHPFLKNKLNGVPQTYKIAVIEDISSTVLNVQGEENEATPHDGGIFMNPLTAILELNSLPEISLSDIHRKPIAYFDLQEYGISGLLKCATFSYNNEYIRTSTGKINGKRIMRKLNDIKWNDDRVDLSNYDFSGHYFQGEDLKFYTILQMTKGENNEYSIELEEIDKEGYRTENYVTFNKVINSNYDLWEALGGEYSMDLVNDKLIYSESSINTVVDIMNNTNFLIEGHDPDKEAHTQLIYEQPLKDKMVSYLVNMSAIKNGAMNVNPSDMYYSDYSDLEILSNNPDVNNLTSFEIGIDNLGIQLNAEHEVDQSHVSEMTQVISALEQLGYEHEISQYIFENIGEAIYSNLGDFLGDVINNETERSSVYKILGKQLVRTFSENPDSDDYGLAQTFIEFIKEDLSNLKNLSESSLAIPFNDPNISSKFLSGFTNGLNKDAIRRQYSGLAAVMSPSHDMITIYDYNGNTVKLSDIRSNSSSIEEFNSTLESMDYYAENEEGILDVGKVGISDYIRIEFPDGTSTEGYVEGYNEKPTSIMNVLSLRGTDARIKILKSKGRNLRPQSATFKIGNQTYTLFDLDSSKLAYALPAKLETFRELVKSKAVEPSIEQFVATLDPSLASALIEEMEWSREHFMGTGFEDAILKFISGSGNHKNIGLYINQMIQRDLDLLQDERVFHMPVQYRSGESLVPISSTIDYSPNEMMLGTPWATQFMLTKGDKLSDISVQFFENKIAKSLRTNLDKNYYDLYLTRNNGKHLHVVFDSNLVDELTPLEVQAVRDASGNIYRVENGEQTYKISSSYKFYTMTDDNGESHEIVYIPFKDISLAVNLFSKSKEFTSLQINARTNNIRRISKAIEKSTLVPNNIKESINNAISQFSEDKLHNQEVVSSLNTLFQEGRNNKIQEQSTKMYQSFKQAINFIVARIPAQSMQSFMNMSIAGFINSNTNIIWVSPDMLVYQGSDY